MKQIYLIFFVVFALSINSFAQKSYQVESKFSNIKSLMFNNESTGFLFYEYDRAKMGKANKKKTSSGKRSMKDIKFSVFDKNLSKVSNNSFQITKHANINSVISNNSHFCFEVIDRRDFEISYIIFNREGKKVATRSLTKEKYPELKKQLTDGFTRPQIAAARDGFYLISYDEKYREGYTIKKVNNDFDKVWSKRVKGLKKEVNTYAKIRYENGSMILINALKAKLVSKEVSYSLTVVDDATGEDVFTYDLVDGENAFLPNQLLKEDDGSVAIAGIYCKGKKLKSNSSDGIFLLKIDANGNKEYTNLIDWKDKLKAEAKKQSKDIDVFKSGIRFFCHNIFKNGDDYDLVVELFRKDLNVGKMLLGAALSIAAASASANSNVDYYYYGGSNVAFEMLDFMKLGMDKESGKMVKIDFIEKKRQKVEIPDDYTEVGSMRLVLSNPYFFTYTASSLPGSANPYFIYTEESGGAKRYKIVSLQKNDHTVREVSFRYPGIFQKSEVSSFKQLDDNNLLFYTFTSKDNTYKFWLELISTSYKKAVAKNKKPPKVTVGMDENIKENEVIKTSEQAGKEKEIKDQLAAIEERLNEMNRDRSSQDTNFEEMSIDDLEKELKIIELKEILANIKKLEAEYKKLN